MARIFVYDNREFPDPDPGMSVDQVKTSFSDFFGELANATVKETKRGEDTVYEFQKRVGDQGIRRGLQVVRWWTTRPSRTCWRPRRRQT